ncbi:Choline dehydrogenase (plasmid) [Variovorax sp. SRS16]|uniref:GMC family oxidoreductase n=1 Tax=Variovorax sp. SRS16 TaxID=282217 RepID=UPI001318C925|nr:GMC family oxidoreductase N-terminal domain-containing protein [Variovorax sp. SRS16]VTU45328.1 Choline dehydrogenase [Variovorax sp. SRS16]
MRCEEFDYVIVGGGSAGCVLATRLSEDPGVKVLLLEAGGRDWHPMLRIPMGVGKLRQGRMYDWGYQTVPQPGLNGRCVELMRGKVLGGSSSVNFMAHNRGNRSDYERWARLGAPEWSYDALLPYFKRSETWLEGPVPHRGSDGPVGVSWTCRDDPIAQAVLDAARAAGHPIFDDLNGPEPNGFGYAQSAIHGGRRASASRAYLRPALSRRNLTLRVNSLATRILFENATATGLQYSWQDRLHEVRANREVIVASGAINSPQLLMLSGIGDADALARLGIRCVQHLPGVGANLQDHLVVSLTHVRAGAESDFHRTLRLDRLMPAFLGAYFAGKGPLTVLPAGVNSILRSRPELDAPDLQIMFGSAAFEAKPWLPGWNEWEDVFALRPMVSHPESRGTVSLMSTDPRTKPRIDPRYLSSAEDMRTLREGLRIVREVARQKPLDGFRGRELAPGQDCSSDGELDAYIRSTATTVQHASCTCRMGRDDLAVVNQELQVHGIERLRVVDASVMPEILSCNIHAAVLAIAERASDLIRGKPAVSGRQEHHLALAA